MSGKRNNDKNKKFFSIILAPHTEGEVKYIRIPLWLCQLACLAVVLFVAGLLVLTYYYRDLKATAEENEYLQEKNRAMKGEIDEVEEEQPRLLEKSEEIEDKIKEVAEMLDLNPPEISNEDEEKDSEYNNR